MNFLFPVDQRNDVRIKKSLRSPYILQEKQAMSMLTPYDEINCHLATNNLTLDGN